MNPESYSYIVDVVPEHFMMGSARAVNLLRSLLHTSFERLAALIKRKVANWKNNSKKKRKMRKKMNQRNGL